MPRLLLHIGTHKTGTTSIQRFCSANRDALRSRGIWYPPADVGSFPTHYAHHRIAHAIAGRDPDRDASTASDFFDRVRKKMGRDETCLISAEPMYRHVLPDPQLETDVSDLDGDDDRFTRYIEAVRDCIGDFDVTVMIMVRRQDLFLESLYAEQILSTGYTQGIERFAADRDHLLDYRARLSGWARAFGDDRISVRVFEASTLTEPIERLFVNWLGIEWDDSLTIGKPHNVTPSRALVEFKRLVNTRGQGVAISTQYRRWLEQLSTKLKPGDVADLGRYYLQPRDRVALLERHAAGNLFVAERYRGDSTLFRDSVNDDLARYVDRPALTNQDFRAVTKLMLRMIAEDLDDARA